MNTKFYTGAILTIVLAGGNILAAEKASKPPVTMDEAKDIAVKRIPGEVESSQMVKKDYSFEIMHNGIKTNVIVNQKGKIKKLVDR